VVRKIMSRSSTAVINLPAPWPRFFSNPKICGGGVRSLFLVGWGRIDARGGCVMGVVAAG